MHCLKALFMGFFSFNFLPASPGDGYLSAADASPNAGTHSCFNKISLISIYSIMFPGWYGSCILDKVNPAGAMEVDPVLLRFFHVIGCDKSLCRVSAREESR